MYRQVDRFLYQKIDAHVTLLGQLFRIDHQRQNESN